MAIDTAVLSSELKNDPQSIGYAASIAAGNLVPLMSMLNAPRTPTVGAHTISSAELLIWGAQNGRLTKLQAAAADTTQSDVLRSVCDAAIRIIQRDMTVLDLSRPDIHSMISALVTAGIFDATDQTSLQTLSTRDISRAEALFGNGSVVALHDVMRAV